MDVEGRPRRALALLLTATLLIPTLALGPGEAVADAQVENPEFEEEPRKEEPGWKSAIQKDHDRDGYGDAWQQRFEDYRDQLLERAMDLDQDGLSNFAEFRWLTIPIGPISTPKAVLFPNAQDYDGDNWTDGDEVAYWNDPSNDDAQPSIDAGPAYATADPDQLVKHDDDNLTTTHDPDSDNDTLLDGNEYTLWRTYPGYADSDCDATAPLCDPPGQTAHEARRGNPGTGDLLPDGKELAAWNLIGPEAWHTDFDGDAIETNLLDPDADGDGLLDGEEFACDTEPHHRTCPAPHLADTDADGLLDGRDLTVPSTDRRYKQFADENITYIQASAGSRTFRGELTARTDATNPDTDGDGLPDGWEVKYRFDPGDASDAEGDADNDNLSNHEEYEHGSSPRARDTDLDRVPDAVEVLENATNPAEWDTDSDGMPDGWEMEHGFNPLDASDADEDPDQDSYQDWAHTNLEEYRYGRPSVHDEATRGPWDHGTDPLNPDTDGDGTSDGQEFVEGTAMGGVVPNPGDVDNDGLLNYEEISRGTEPGNPDTDGDGLCDGGRGAACISWATGEAGAPGEALDYGSDANESDTDGDGLLDGEEAQYFDPLASGSMDDPDADGSPPIHDHDSDNDGLTDGEEALAFDTDPSADDTDGDGFTDHEEARLINFQVGGRLDPTLADTDGDGLTDWAEVRETRTHALLADTDLDGIDDAREVHETHTNPGYWDTDGDRMPDAWEVRYGLDPLSNDATGDYDRDLLALGLTNRQEYEHERPTDWQEWRDGTWWNGTNPAHPDTDLDGIDDYTEILTGILDPLAPDSELDYEQDGVPNLVEYAAGTNVNDSDTDGDGLGDAWEIGPDRPVELPSLYAEPVLREFGLTGLAEQLGIELPTIPGVSNHTLARFLELNAPTGALASDPTLADTDEDGISDGRELAYWNTLGPDAWRTNYHAENPSVRGVVDDAVRTGATAVPFSTHINNLRDPDADGDRLDDGQEILVFRTLPHAQDTDTDGYSDYEEIMGCSSNPNDPASHCGTSYPTHRDTDGDGWNDFDEHYVHGTDPERMDTDGDGLTDKHEWSAWNTSTGKTRAFNDIDGDGPLDVKDRPNNLLDPDSDNDGIPDGLEFGAAGLPDNLVVITDPLNPDTDGDGLLDGEEARNDFYLQAAACARENGALTLEASLAQATGSATRPDWVTQDDPTNPCRKITGAYGVPLYRGTSRPSTGTPASTAATTTPPPPENCPNPANGFHDSDRDGLSDHTEIRYNLKPCNTDSDHDGLTDKHEFDHFRTWKNGHKVLDDSDNDGNPDILDPDSDNDGLLDGEETHTYNTDPQDGDTDDDGVGDGQEVHEHKIDPTHVYGTDPANFDTDKDGLPDGYELGNTTRVTSNGVLFTGDRYAADAGGCGTGKTFVPHQTGLTPAKRADGRNAVHLSDQDGDGLLDILETPPFYDSGTNVALADTDEDRLYDGLELQIWGFNEYCALLHHASFAGSEAALNAVLRWNETDLAKNPLRMDPNLPDLDNDGVMDGFDLQPYKTKLYSTTPDGVSTPTEESVDPVLGLELATYQTLDPVDGSCYGEGSTKRRVSMWWNPNICVWWPEPQFKVDLSVGGLLPIELGSIVFDEFESHDAAPLSGLLSDGSKLEVNPGPTVLRSFKHGLFQIALPSNIKAEEYGGISDLDELRSIEVKISIVDHDPTGDDDVIDLHPSEDETTFIGTHRLAIRGNNPEDKAFVQEFRRFGQAKASAGRHGDNGDVQADECSPETEGSDSRCVQYQGNVGKNTDAGRLVVRLIDPMRIAWFQYARIAAEEGHVAPHPHPQAPLSAMDTRKTPW